MEKHPEIPKKGRGRKKRLPSESTWFPNYFYSWWKSKAEGLCSPSLDGIETHSVEWVTQDTAFPALFFLPP